jgi:hypothetical protein
MSEARRELIRRASTHFCSRLREPCEGNCMVDLLAFLVKLWGAIVRSKCVLLALLFFTFVNRADSQNSSVPGPPPNYPTFGIDNNCQCPLVAYIRSHSSKKDWTKILCSAGALETKELATDDTFDIVIIQCSSETTTIWSEYSIKNLDLKKLISDTQQPAIKKLAIHYLGERILNPQTKIWTPLVNTDNITAEVDVLITPFKYIIKIPDIIKVSKPLNNPNPPPTPAPTPEPKPKPQQHQLFTPPPSIIPST